MNPDLRRRLLDVARGPDGRWVATPQAAEARRLLTRADPQLFALIYLPKHLRGPETGDLVSFSQFHLDCFTDAVEWLEPDPGPGESRIAYVAPRGAGKSTAWFLLIPMWAAAHLVVDFIAAFADSATQAEGHLQTFKAELERNTLLRYDYPTLCAPALRGGKFPMADNRGMYLAESGFVFTARGIDSRVLGLKVGERRPRVLLFDDVEPDEASYSPDLKEKRLATIRDAAYPLSLNARVVHVGTTTMYGSIMHDIVRQATDPETAPQWPQDENIRTRYYPAIVTRDDGSEASLWPERWSLDYLQSIRHTRSFRKNMLNLPATDEGGFWSEEDIRYGWLEAVTRRVLSIDPAVTSKTKSDATGLVVVGFDPTVGKCQVEAAVGVRLAPAPLREKVLRMLDEHDVRHVVVEVNNGGDWILESLAPLPAKVVSVRQTAKKEARAALALDHYQAGRVVHVGRLPALEDQMLAFPKVVNDDIVDAASTAILLFLKDMKRPTPKPQSRAYA